MAKAMELTSRQQQVLEVLRQVQRPLGAYALLKIVRKDGFTAPTQVYRVLERLIQYGLVHRLETLNAYVACSHGHGHGAAAFAICDNCGHIDELVDGSLSEDLARLAKRCAFAPQGSTIEIHGRCAACNGSAHGAAP